MTISRLAVKPQSISQHCFIWSCGFSFSSYGTDMSQSMTKPTKWQVRELRLRSAWASAQSDQSSQSAWRKLVFLAIYWVQSKDSDQPGHLPRLIWVFAWRKCHFVGFAHMSWSRFSQDRIHMRNCCLAIANILEILMFLFSECTK